MKAWEDPVGLPGLAALTLGLLALVVALFAARRRVGREPDGGSARSARSKLGIAVQALAIFLTAFGAQRVTLDPLGLRALAEAGLVALLMASAVGLFVAAAHALGRNWSLVARTRDDHRLIEDGPFARVRHPIYAALFLVVLAMAVALGHLAHLLAAVPLYALGTWLRVGEEERLLRAAFGTTYEAYAVRVKRFVPGLF